MSIKQDGGCRNSRRLVAEEGVGLAPLRRRLKCCVIRRIAFRCRLLGRTADIFADGHIIHESAGIAHRAIALEDERKPHLRLAAQIAQLLDITEVEGAGCPAIAVS